MITQSLRATLLIQELGPIVVGPARTGVTAYLLQVVDQCRYPLGTAPNIFVWADGEILIPVFLLVTIGLALALARRDPHRYLALAVVQMAMVSTILLVGIVVETSGLLDPVPCHSWMRSH